MGQRMKLGGKWRALDMFLKVRGEWKAAESVYVKVNGVWRIGQHIHDFIYVSNGAESTHTATCAHCNKKITEGHIYYLTGKKDATCTEDGYEIFLCNKCSQERRVVLEAQGHDWETVTITEPTCTDGGEELDQCSRCGEVSETRYTDPLGHVYGDPVYNEATCTEHGGNTYTCARCGHSWFDLLEDALGHDYHYTGSGVDGNGVTYFYYACSRCGDAYDQAVGDNGEPL